jgi:uncharacterized protein (TIGR03067 family)
VDANSQLTSKGYPMILLMTLFAVLSVSDPTEDKAKKLLAEESEKLQGTWKLARLEPPELKVKEDYRVTFKGDKVTFGDRPPCRFQIDPGKDPKWFDSDIGALFGGKEEVYAPGIYKLDGDKLILASVTEREGQVFKPRPKNFEDKFHGQFLRLERVKK